MEQVTGENRKYLKTMAQAFNKTPIDLLNCIIEAHRKKNAILYERAKRASNAGGQINLLKP